MQEERKESATGGANGSASDSLTVSLQEEVAALKLQLTLCLSIREANSLIVSLQEELCIKLLHRFVLRSRERIQPQDSLGHRAFFWKNNSNSSHFFRKNNLHSFFFLQFEKQIAACAEGE